MPQSGASTQTWLKGCISSFNIWYYILTLFPPCLKLHSAFIDQNSHLKKMVDAVFMCSVLENCVNLCVCSKEISLIHVLFVEKWLKLAVFWRLIFIPSTREVQEYVLLIHQRKSKSAERIWGQIFTVSTEYRTVLMLLIELFISHKHEWQAGRIQNLWLVCILFPCSRKLP